MKKTFNIKLVMIVILLLSVIILGCDNLNFLGGSDEPTGAGLLMMWEPGVPPQRWYENEPFELQLSIRNTGNYDLGRSGSNYVFIRGYDQNILSFDSTFKPVPKIDPATRLIPEGGEERITFYSSGATIGSQDTFTTPIQAKLCYYYETKANPEVCLDPTPDIRTATSEVCQPHSTSGGNQGGPVVVTTIDQETSRTETIFTVRLQNVGPGRVVTQDYFTPYNCESGFLPQHYDKVYIELEDGNGCKPNPVNVGPNGAATTRCSFNAYSDLQHAYPTQLHFTLKYGYEQIMVRQITFVKTE